MQYQNTEPSLNGLGNVKTLIASGSKINVRSQPSTSSGIVRTVEQGQVVGTLSEAFTGGDGYTWYELKEGGFVREDVVSVTTTNSSPGKKSNFKLNPWVIGIGVLLVAGIGYSITSNKSDQKPRTEPNSGLAGKNKTKRKTSNSKISVYE